MACPISAYVRHMLRTIFPTNGIVLDIQPQNMFGFEQKRVLLVVYHTGQQPQDIMLTSPGVATELKVRG